MKEFKKEKRRILVIEDNTLNREMLKEILSDEYDVICAENGSEGLDILRKQAHGISAIMLDIEMPVMNGYDFLKYVINDTVYCKIPVIVETVLDSVEEEEKCLELGAADFITKPYNPKLILMRVRNIIKLIECDHIISELEVDALTGFKNRKAYYEAIREIENDPVKSAGALGIVFADVNGLKRVNDMEGHEAGDRLLADIANTLAEVFVGADKYRIGGDEFVIIDYEKDKHFFEQKIDELRTKWQERQSAAIGSIWLEHAQDLEENIAIADKEMYRDKSRYYEKKIHDRRQNNNSGVEEYIRQAERLAREIQEESIISGALSKEYSSLFKIDAETGKISLYRTDGIGMSPQVLEKLLVEDEYESVLMKYIDTFVVEEDRARLRELGRLNVLHERVPETGLYKMGYRRDMNGIISYFEMNVAKTVDNAGKITFILGLRDVDEEMRRQLKQAKKIKIQQEIIEGLGAEYYSVLLVDPETDRVTTFRAEEKEGVAIKEFFRRYGNCWSKGIYSYGCEMIAMSGRSEFCEKLSLDYIRANDKDYSFSYEKLTGEDTIYLQTTVTYVCDKDGSLAVVIGTRNVDDLIKKEKRQERMLQKALEDAEAANKAKTDFLSKMSHDIRTPLNGIMGLLEMDERHPDDRELIEENRGKIKVELKHLNSLLNDILQLSKLENSNSALSEEMFNLNTLAEDIITMVAVEANEHGIEFHYGDYSQKFVVPVVWGSPVHLRQIFLNIFSNAIKYNKPGGSISCVAQCEAINDKTVTYKCTVKDTGIGMSKEFMEHIFEPFTQERSDARSTYQGTGLGMAIVKSLVDKMNGTIEIESKVGQGTTFTVTIPFEIAEESYVKKEEPEGNIVSIEGLNILLVEDNELNMEIAEVLLEDAGAVVTKAYDGKQAVDLFIHKPAGTFDVILMDIMMPVMNGLDAARRIRGLERSDAGNIPIIAMTANAFEEDRQATKNAGMNAHMSKPLDSNALLKAISNCSQKYQNGR